MSDNGKKESFEKEALIHLDALHRTALRMTKNEGDANDLVQEAFLKAYRFWDKFEEGTNCRAWLFKIMTNIFINNYRSKSWKPQIVELDEVDDDFMFGKLSANEDQGDPERSFLSKVFEDDVKAAIEELPDDFRMAIMLSFIEGFSYQEIADITDLNIGTVKSRLHRGRKLLQKSLWQYAIRNGFAKETSE